MITWKQLLFEKAYRKWLIILIVISNILFVLNVSYIFYFKESFFDKAKRPAVDTKAISQIEVREGSWKWTDKEWPFSHDTKLMLTNRGDIDTFCRVLESAPSKYIDNIRPTQWLNIYFTENGNETLSIVLNENYQKEIFVEYNDHTYDGTQIVSLLKSFSKTKSQ